MARISPQIMALLVFAAAAPTGRVDAQPETLFQALVEGRVTASDLRGREVFDLEDVLLGTLFGINSEGRQQRDYARVELNPALGLGGGVVPGTSPTPSRGARTPAASLHVPSGSASITSGALLSRSLSS